MIIDSIIKSYEASDPFLPKPFLDLSIGESVGLLKFLVIIDSIIKSYEASDPFLPKFFLDLSIGESVGLLRVLVFCFFFFIIFDI